MTQVPESATGASPRHYPLTFSQNAIFMAWKYSIFKSVMNVPTSVLTDIPLDLELLRQAAQTAISRNDAFGIRIRKEGGKWMQRFGERQVLLLETVDFTGQTEQAMEAFFRKVATTPMRLSDRPLAKIYLVRAPAGNCGMFTCISHLIMDSWAIFLFYKDTLSIYYALRDGEPMPKPLRSCEATLQKDQAYIASPRYEEDRAFWIRELTEPEVKPIATHINGREVLERQRKRRRDPEYRFRQSFDLRSKAAHEILPIRAADITRMKAYCEAHNFPTLSLLLYFGIRTYLAKTCDRPEAISLYNVVARRSTLEEKYSGGTRVHFLTFTTAMDERVTFREGLDRLRLKQDQIYRRADFDPLGQFTIDYTYVGLRQTEDYRALAITFNPVPIDLGHNLRVATKWYCNGSAGQDLYLTVMDDDGSGGLRCYYEYRTHAIRPERIRLCHDYALRVIHAGIANPDITLGELLELPLAAEPGVPERTAAPAPGAAE